MTIQQSIPGPGSPRLASVVRSTWLRTGVS